MSIHSQAAKNVPATCDGFKQNTIQVMCHLYHQVACVLHVFPKCPVSRTGGSQLVDFQDTFIHFS